MAIYKGDTLLAGIGAPEIPEGIVYLTQSEYDELTEEEKMDGTSYGIIGSSVDDSMMESLRKMILGGGETSSLSLPNPGTIEIPDWCNIVYINGYGNNGNYGYSSYSIILAKGFPSTQYIGHASGDYYGDCIRVLADWDSRTITFQRVISGSGSYVGATITFC